MKHTIIAIALLAAAAAHAQETVRTEGGTFTPIAGTVKGYMAGNVATYSMLWQYTSNDGSLSRRTRYTVTGCDEGQGVLTAYRDGTRSNQHEWALNGQQAFDGIAIETCAAALEWLKSPQGRQL